MASHWHYPRTDFANLIIDGMQQDLLDRVSIFAPRKRGKTQFIQNDIMPLCRERGILPIYVDFWMNKNDPQSVFIKSVMSACEQEKSLLQRLIKRYTPSKFSFDAKSHKVELGFDRKEQTQQPDLFDVFSELNKMGIPILLLLDEIQHLATRPEFEDFTAALRSFTVNRQNNNVKCIFTGSSREGLNQLFRNSQAPFYNSSETLNFKELDEDFVRHELEAFALTTGGIQLDKNQALEVLISQNRSPGRFVGVLQKMAIYRVYDLLEGVNLYDEQELDSKSSFQAICSELKPLDLTLLRLIAINQATGIYTDKGIQKIVVFSDLDEAEVNKGSIRNAINRLRDKNLIYSPSRGKWIIENPEFKDFLIQS